MKKKFFILCISIILIILVSIFLFITLSFNNNIPVIAYHNIVDSPSNSMEVSIKDFEKQMKWLYKHNYKTLTMDEFYDWKVKNKKIKGKKIVITFDDGYESVYKNAMPILKKYKMNATVFMITKSINSTNYLKEKQLFELEKNNIEVESHTYNSHNQEISFSNDYNIYYDDCILNKDYNYKYFAYPYGESNENYIKALKECDIKLAFLYNPSKWANINQNNYTITRVPIYMENNLLKFKMKVLLNIKK